MSWNDLAPLVSGFVGAIIGAGASIWSTRASNRHQRALARDATDAAQGAEIRALRRDAYGELAYRLIDIQRAGVDVASPFQVAFTADEWRAMVAKLHTVASVEIRESTAQLSKLMLATQSARADFLGSHGVASHVLYSPDDRVSVELKNKQASDALFEHVNGMLSRLNLELTWVADFSRTEGI